MVFSFNSFDLAKPPKISIHRVDLEMIGYLQAENIVIKATFCNLSELSFKVYKGTQFYDCIIKCNVLEVEGFGRWEIQTAKEDKDGVTAYKEVTAYSYESSLNKTTLTYKDDTVFKLWDAVHPLGDGTSMNKATLLGIIQNQTGWNIAHVDGTLLNSYRTMSIDGEEVYGLLAGDISEAFKCYFVFDTMERKIYCYDRERTLVNSGINLSFRNLIIDMNKTQSSDDITTALTVTGAEGVGINLVNPLGNNVIYNFDYYMNDYEWGMPKDLQTAVKAWLKKIDDNSETYSELVTKRRTTSDELITLDGELSVLTSELKSWQDVQAVDIAGNPSDLPRVKGEIDRVNGLISAKNTAIKNKKTEYDNCVKSINNIVTSLSFEKNFTKAQIEKLQYYINGSVYENENFVFTSTQTESEQINIAQQLYDYGLTVMDKLSKPLYEFTCNVAGFMFTKLYQEFAKNLELGVGVNLEIEDNVWVTPRVMQIVLDFDNTENATIVLSDSYRLGNDTYIFANDYNQTIKASRKTSMSASKWDEPIKNNFYGNVTEYINNALNLANQEIINATNQEFTLGSYGLRGKKYIESSDSYDPHQVAMTNNVLAFTDDNWNSCKTALGNVTIGGTNYYGLVAEAIFGNIVAGNQLTISDENSTFVMDGSGATLYNADFTTVNNVNKVVLSPTDCIIIQKKDGENWKTVLSTDGDGNLMLEGSIEAKTGSTIAGWTTTADSFTSPTGDYIGSNGTGKLSLMTWNNSQATFDGNIYAHNLNWRYGNSDYQLFTNLDGLGLSLGGGDLKLPKDQNVLFGGDFYVGNANNNTKIYSRLADVSSEAKNLQSIFIHSGGNVTIDTDKGGLLVKTENGIGTTKLSVTNESTYNGKATFFDEIESQKKLTVTTASVFSGDISFNDKPAFNKGILIENGISLSGLIQVEYHGEIRNAVDGEFQTADGKTVQVTDGIITGIT